MNRQWEGLPWHVAVLIPARDEEELIGRCLRSVLEAARMLPPEMTCDIVVVSDGSTDGTVRIARQMLAESLGTTVEIDAQCVGTARAVAARIAMQRYSGPIDRCWLANTDADCEVPATWLLQQVSHAGQGWAGVAGIVDVDSFMGHDAGVPERFRSTYLTHADGTHPHVHGANLGIRADAYVAAGGWSPLVTAEDHDLWGRLRDGQYRCLADAALCVVTSGRRMGRAPMGFARALEMHNEGVR